MYRSMIKMHYKGVHVCILVYDISDQSSFDAIEKWFTDVKDQLVNTSHLSKPSKSKKLVPPKDASSCLFYLVGNKSDLESERQVSTATAQKFVDEKIKESHKMHFFEISAKTGDKIPELFDDIST